MSVGVIVTRRWADSQILITEPQSNFKCCTFFDGTTVHVWTNEPADRQTDGPITTFVHVDATDGPFRPGQKVSLSHFWNVIIYNTTSRTSDVVPAHDYVTELDLVTKRQEVSIEHRNECWMSKGESLL